MSKHTKPLESKNEDELLDEIFDDFEKRLQESSGSMAFQKRAITAKSQIQELIATARIDGLIMARYGVDYDSKEERFIDNLIRQEEAELEDK